MSCTCEVHEGKEYLNQVYPLSVDQMFILLFTDSPFFRDFQNYRNASDNQLQVRRLINRPTFEEVKSK